MHPVLSVLRHQLRLSLNHVLITCHGFMSFIVAFLVIHLFSVLMGQAVNDLSPVCLDPFIDNSTLIRVVILCLIIPGLYMFSITLLSRKKECL